MQQGRGDAGTVPTHLASRKDGNMGLKIGNI